MEEPYVPYKPIPAPFEGQHRPNPPIHRPPAALPPVRSQPIETPAPSTPTPRRRSYGRIGGGWFGPKPRQLTPVVGAVGGRILPRIIPFVGWGLAAYDGYQLGCSSGLLPAAMCPPFGGGSDSPPLTPPFRGGQCVVEYQVQLEWSSGGYNGLTPYKTGTTTSGNPTRIGPIAGIRTDASTTADGKTYYAFHVLFDGGRQSIYMGGGTPFSDARFILMRRIDGQPDNCGDPEPMPWAPPDLTQPPLQRDPPFNTTQPITPPSPESPTYPLPQPFPFPIPFQYPAPGSYYPDYDGDGVPDYPSEDGGDGEDGDNGPDEGEEDEGEEGEETSICDEPCIEDIQKKLDEILEKFEEPQELEPFELAYVRKQDDKCKLELYRFQVVKGSVPEEVKHKFLASAQLALDGCHVDPIAAVPEWWPIRAGVTAPQLVVMFAEKVNGRLHIPMYVVTIPHYSGPHRQKPLIPSYRKGSHQGMLILSDNSKVHVNAASQGEAQRLIGAIKGYIDGSFLAGSQERYGERRGVALKEITVYPTLAKYFSKGQKNMKPDWFVSWRV